VDYPEDNLILTGIRNTTKGVYLLYENMMELAEHWNIPIVKAVNGLAVQDINLFVKQVREWESDEGVVIRFNSGKMVKVKADDYVLRHKSKESINQEKNVLEFIIGNHIDDIAYLLPENDVIRIKTYQKLFWKEFYKTKHNFEKLYESGDHYENQKDFAVEFVNKLESKFKPFMFGIKRGYNLNDLLIDSIKKSLATQTKVDEVRWIWGNYRWDEI
jgi:hypothetical protein